MAIGDFPYDIEFLGGPIEPEPSNAIAGDTLAWERNFPNCPASVGWTITYVLNSSTARILVNSADVTTNGDAFSIDIPSAETATWAPGKYQWLAVAQLPAAGTVPAQRQTAALGRIVIAHDLLDASTPQDTRSNAEVALCNIDLMIAGRANDGVQEYTINGRMLRRYPLTELTQLRSLYRAIVRQERADRGEYQLPSTVAVHFG